MALTLCRSMSEGYSVSTSNQSSRSSSSRYRSSRSPKLGHLSLSVSRCLGGRGGGRARQG
jgi:hypothetical protein